MAEPARRDLVQAPVFDAEGKPVAPELAAEAVATGKGFYQQGARVYARNHRGEVVTVDAADATRPGYQVLSQAELERAQLQREYGEGVGNVALAGTAGAARGLTLGASDAVLSGIGGDDTRRALKGLREANPVTSAAGEIVGAVAPVLLTSGGAAPATAGSLARAGAGTAQAVRAAGVLPRAVAGVGSLVERGVARGLAGMGYEGTTLAGRVGAGALKLGLQGATEGALYGAAQAANDSVLNGDAITAEKIVAGMGHGALFGGALGAGLGAVGPLATAAASKFVPKKEALQRVARDQALDAAGFTGPQRGKLMGRLHGEAGQARIDATADDLLHTVLETGERKGQRVLQPGANVGETLERISQAKNEFGARLGGLKDEISDRMAAAGEAPSIDRFFRRVKEEVTGPLFASKIQGARSQARAVERQLQTLVDEHATRLAAAQGDAAAIARIEAGEVPAMAPTFRELEQVRAALRDVFQPKAPPTGGLPPPPPKSAQYLEKTERILADVLKEDAGRFLAKVGENPNAYNELNRQFSSFAKLESVAAKAEQMQLGRRAISPSDHALGVASFLGALSTGNVGALGAMGMGGAASVANKLLRERGNSLVADMARRASELDTSIDRVAQVLAGKAERAKAPALGAALQGENLRETYERTANRVRELATPQAAQAHISSLIPEVAAQYPLVGTSVSTKLLQIYQQLQAKLPQNHVSTGTTLTPMAARERVPPGAMRSFLANVRGALEPERVIAELEHGTVDREAIEALKIAHPLTFAQLRSKVADYVSERQDELPYKRRVMLSMTFDFVGDETMEPATLAGLQETAQALTVAEQIQDANMVKPPSGGGPHGTTKASKAMTLPAQAAISGEM